MIGGLIFLLFAAVDDRRETPADVIVVTPERIDQLAAGYSSVWKRMPTDDELDALIDDHIREEVYNREAMVLGLDRNDAVVRRRLRQKMKFLADTGAAYLARWTASCPGGLEAGVIQIDGLDQTSTDVLARFDFADGVSQARRLTPSDSSFTVPTQPSRLEVVQTYFLFGVAHISLGIDHLLFVLALLLLVKGVRRVIATVTAFTLAHSLTLAGATLGLVHLPGPPIEAVIALSIVFVASEIVHGRRGKPGLTEKFPWLVAFAFGLLHGFGFAGALAEVGLPQDSIPIALLFFNVGVEIGQLLFIAAVFAIVALTRRTTRRINLPRPTWGWAVPPYAIGSLAVFWVIQRIAAF